MPVHPPGPLPPRRAAPLPAAVDVVVIGAGTAGAAAAAFVAESGARVLCVDRAPLDAAGARWINGVPAWAFDRAGLDQPTGAERRGEATPVHLIAGGERVVIADHGVLEVDMRHLVTRLQARARNAGAELIGETAVRGRDGDHLVTDQGRVRAGVFVDASGLAGAHLLPLPRVPAHHLCAAAQEVREVADLAAARAWFAAHEVPPGEIACFAGVAGGFSVLNVRLDEHDGTVSILTGSIPVGDTPSGKAILDRFAAGKAWVGATRFGGARALPLRRSYDRIAAGRVAVLGDAACQMFPAHGSGIGVGMIAARLLADALAGGGGLRAYEVAWQRGYGGLCAGYDVFRRFSQRLDEAAIARMMRAGLLDPVLARAGMAQHTPSLPLAAIPGKVAALAREPAIGRALLATVGRMTAVRALYAAYPTHAAAVPAWGRLVAPLFGERADPAPDRQKVATVGAQVEGGRHGERSHAGRTPAHR